MPQKQTHIQIQSSVFRSFSGRISLLIDNKIWCWVFWIMLTKQNFSFNVQSFKTFEFYYLLPSSISSLLGRYNLVQIFQNRFYDFLQFNPDSSLWYGICSKWFINMIDVAEDLYCPRRFLLCPFFSLWIIDTLSFLWNFLKNGLFLWQTITCKMKASDVSKTCHCQQKVVVLENRWLE